MIIDSDARMLKIKRANTDWWINERSIVAENGKTYIAYCTDTGELHVKQIDAKCSSTQSRDVRVSRLNLDYSDEHNAPGMCITEKGKIIVFYTGHNENGFIFYRITEKPFDIFSFGEEKRIKYEGRVSYVQLFENTSKHQLWLFSRLMGKNWTFTYSSDDGMTWSKPKVFIRTNTNGSSGLYYLDIRKLLIPEGSEIREEWFFAVYGHPRSNDHKIRSGIFDEDGELLSQDGTRMGYSVFDENDESISLDRLETVYDSPENTSVRLLEVSPLKPYRIGIAAFRFLNPESCENPDPDSIVYYIVRWNKTWELSEPIAKGGEFLAPGQSDGSQTYVGGMAVYYGVGDAGFHPFHAKNSHTTSDRVFIARFDGKNRVLESYSSKDGSRSYQLEQTIRSIPADDTLPVYEQTKIWRPVVPVFAQDNLPVYWHEGTYAAHTGGWHSDAVMFVMYDD